MEEVLGELRPHVIFEPPIFPQSISWSDWNAPPPPYSPQLAWRSLLFLYFFAVTNADGSELTTATGDGDDRELTKLPTVYETFCGGLPPGTSFITTNYDEVAERAFTQSERSWGYPTDWLIWERRDCPAPASLPAADIQICRLHGNFRWIQCRNCTLTYALDWWAALPVGPFGQFLNFENPRTFRCPNPECLWFPLHVVFLDFPRAAWRRDIGPANPNHRKTYNVECNVLQDQWSAAASVAERCERLLIVGSALRPEDEGLLSIVAAAGRKASYVSVIDPSVAALRRARSITGKNPRWYRSLEQFVSAH